MILTRQVISENRDGSTRFSEIEKLNKVIAPERGCPKGGGELPPQN